MHSLQNLAQNIHNMHRKRPEHLRSAPIRAPKRSVRTCRSFSSGGWEALRVFSAGSREAITGCDSVLGGLRPAMPHGSRPHGPREAIPAVHRDCEPQRPRDSMESYMPI